MAHAASLLGHAPEVGLRSALTLDARVSRDPDGSYRLELRSESADPPSSRGVRASSCAEVADAAALLLALAIDPSAPLSAPANVAFEPETSATTASPPPTPPANTEPDQVAPANREPSRDAARPEAPASRLQWLVGGSLSLWARRLPALAPGMLAEVGLASGRWELRGSLGYFPPQHAALPNAAAGGDMWLLSSGASVGYAATTGRVRAAAQLGLGLGLMHGNGSGVSLPEGADLGLVSVDGGARLAYQVSSAWFLVGHGLLSGLLTRPRFVLEGGSEVHRPDAVGVRFGLGAEWRQP